MGSIFVDGFDKYVERDDMFKGEWTGYEGNDIKNNFIFVDGIAPLNIGKALRMNGEGSVDVQLYKTLAATYTTMTVGFHFKGDIQEGFLNGFGWRDGTDAQFSISIDATGRILLKKGRPDTGTLIATSAESLSNGVTHSIEATITFHATTGAYDVFLDGVQVLNATNIDTTDTANNSVDGIFKFSAETSGAFIARNAIWDSLYLLDDSGGAPLNAILGQAVVETTFPTSDSATAFSVVQGYIGAPYNDQTSSNRTANQLYLRKFTAPVAGNIASVAIMPAATNGTVKFKAAIYADNGSGTAPDGTALKAGDEITGATADAALTLTLPSVLAVTATTIYWIGYITDTTLSMRDTDNDSLGFTASATYSSGVPDPAPTMSSGAGSTELWANVTGITSEFAVVDFEPEDLTSAVVEDIEASLLTGDLSYVSSSTVNHEDLYGHNALRTAPSTIFTIAVKNLAAKSDGGARTFDCRCKSVATTSSGGTTGHSPATSYAYFSSFVDLDPDAAAAWTEATLNAASKGHKLIS